MTQPSLLDYQPRPSTSVRAFANVNFPSARQEVLSWVAKHPNHTGRELERLSGLRKLNARLSELERMDLIERGTPVRCGVTGELAASWTATGRPARPLKARQSSSLKARIAELEQAVAVLKATLDGAGIYL